MNYRMITKIACKMLALYFFLFSMNYLPNILITIISYKEYANLTQNIIPWFSNGIILLLTAMSIWFFADKLSVAIVKDLPESVEGKEVDYHKIAIIAFTVVGLFVLTKAVPELIRVIVMDRMMLSSQLGYYETKLQAETIARIVSEIIKVGLGLWLLIGAKGIFRGVKALRNIGLDRISNIEG